jgi:hypothetical protein
MSANIEVAEVDDRRDAQAPIASAGTAKHGTNFALDTVLYPSDSYKDGVYWADLPYGERVAWVNAQGWAEVRADFLGHGLTSHRVYINAVCSSVRLTW